MNYLKRKISCVLMIAFAVIVANTFPLAVYAQNLVINNCKPVGAVEYKPNGCSTSMRTCCQGGQTSSGLFVLQNWSGWNEDCPELCVEKNPCTSNADCCGGKVCKASSSGGIVRKVCQLASVEDNCLESQKPTCSLSNGTCKYNCTCSNGKWTNQRPVIAVIGVLKRQTAVFVAKLQTAEEKAQTV